MRYVKAFLVSFALLVISIYAMAQRPDFSKMSALVREACVVVQNHNAVLAKSRTPYRPQYLTAFVKTTNPVSDLSAQGCKILAQYGNLYIVSMPINSIAPLSLRPDVMRIEAGRGNELTMDTTIIIVGAATAHEGLGLPRAFTGKGVVVGVQDIGFDLTHPTFYSGDMRRYRIKAMWDQLSSDTIGSSLPVGRDYRDSVSLLTVGHPLDGLIQTHGTHTAGIAAGGGSEGEERSPYSGIAPDADICLVCNATSNDAALVSEEDQYKYTYAMDALGFKYIFDYADKAGKPCVINFSEGSLEDFRGDDALYYEMLDSLLGPGHIIVSSAGNEGAKINYLDKPLDTDSAEIFATSRWHSKTMSFTTRSTGDFNLKLLLDGKQLKSFALHDIVLSADSTINDSMLVNGVKYKVTAMVYPDCYDSARITADWIITSERYIFSTNFTVRLTGAESDVELYPSTALLGNERVVSGLLANDSYTTLKVPAAMPLGDNTHSILSPGSAPNVICVGLSGYRNTITNIFGNNVEIGGSSNGKININSSIGPTFDGRIKPDVVAPGQAIISSFSSFYKANNPDTNSGTWDVRSFDYNGRTYYWSAGSGSSMSAPVVTGVIALWLQADPRLTPQECLDVISKTSRHTDESLAYPNNVYGYGEIDAEAGLKLILEKTTGVKSVAVDDKTEKRIYTLDGRYIGTKLHNLPRGLYIIGKRKVVIR